MGTEMSIRDREEVAELHVRIQRGGIDVQDLLIDRDGLRIKARLGKLLGDLSVGSGRLIRLAPLHKQVADLETDVGIGRIRLKELVVLLQGLVIGPLLDELLRRLEGLTLVDRWRQNLPSLALGDLYGAHLS